MPLVVSLIGDLFVLSTFNMDEFKRCYSNNDTVTVALPYFWKNLDRENYSIWYCEYLEDLSKNLVFMTCNLVGGEQNARTGTSQTPCKGWLFQGNG